MSAKEFEYIGTTATEELRANLRLINTLYAFIVVLLFSIILGYAFGPLSGSLKWLPTWAVGLILFCALMLTIAGYLMSVVLTGKMVASINEHNQKSNDIFMVTHAIRGNVNLEAVFNIIISYALRMTRSNAGYILIFEGDKLVLKATKGGGFERFVGHAVAPEVGLAGAALTEGVAMSIGEGQETELTSTLEGTVKYQTRSGACVPIKTRRGHVGVLELLNSRQGHYDESDMKVLEFISEQAAVSMELSALYKRLSAQRKKQ